MESLRACAPYLASTPGLEWYIVADVAVRDLIGLIEGSIRGFGGLNLSLRISGPRGAFF
jgi:hypothetical protein